MIAKAVSALKSQDQYINFPDLMFLIKSLYVFVLLLNDTVKYSCVVGETGIKGDLQVYDVRG